MNRHAKGLTLLAAVLLASSCRRDEVPRAAAVGEAPPDRSVVRRIWAGEGEISALSRDGRYLAYSSDSSNAIFLHELTTGQVRQVTAGTSDLVAAAYSPLPSPDGSHVTHILENYQSDLEDGLRSELHVVRSDGAAARMLFAGTKSDDWAVPVDWTSDGQHVLAVLDTERNGKQLVLLATDGSTSRVLKSFAWQMPEQPAFSPDDRYVGYATELRADAATAQVHILDTRTGRETRLGPAVAGVGFLGWSPDGHSILYSVQDGALTDIWRLALRNGRQVGEPTIVQRGLLDVQGAGSTVRGVVYRVSHGTRTIHVADIDVANATMQPATEVAAVRNRWLPLTSAWSRDGEYVAYARQQRTQPRSAIVIRSLRTGTQREIVIRPPILWVLGVQWDSAGRDLMFVGSDRASRISKYRLPLATGVPELYEVPDGGAHGVFRSGWDTLTTTRDGRHRFVISRVNDLVKVIVEDVRTGTRTLVFSGEIYQVSFSRDETMLAGFIDHKELDRELIIVTLRGPRAGTVVRYTPPIGNAIAPVWTPDGRYLLFPAAPEPGSRARWNLWRLEVATGEVVAVAGLTQDLVALQLSDDGRQVLLYGARETDNTELWLIDEQAPVGDPGSQ